MGAGGAMLWLLDRHALGFVGMMVLATMVLVIREDFELALHQRKQYIGTDARGLTRKRYWVLSLVRGGIMGIFAGLLPAILIGGATGGGFTHGGICFVILVLVGFVGLHILRDLRGIKPVTYALVRFPVPLGLGFAGLRMLQKPEVGWDTVRDLWTVLRRKFDDELTFDEGLEVLHSAMELIDSLLGASCLAVFGDPLGRFVHLFLTIDLAFGLSITCLSLALLKFGDLLGQYGSTDAAREESSPSDRCPTCGQEVDGA